MEVSTFILCPHTALPLDFLPRKMRKNRVYKSHKVTLCLFFLFVVHLAFPTYFFCVRRLAGPQRSMSHDDGGPGEVRRRLW